MSYPRVEVDTKKIRYNTKVLVEECKKKRNKSNGGNQNILWES